MEGRDTTRCCEADGMDLIQGLLVRDLGLILDLILSHLDTKVHRLLVKASIQSWNSSSSIVI